MITLRNKETGEIRILYGQEYDTGSGWLQEALYYQNKEWEEVKDENNKIEGN
jgi:hypothetical protein